MRNHIINSRFRQGAVGPVRITNGGAWVANRWWVGSGVGADCEASREPFPVGQTAVPGNPEWFLRVRWLSPPTQGEDQYLPECRWTWLEHHMLDARELVGTSVRYRGALRVASGELYVVPIFWTNYSSGDYVIHSCPGVSVGTSWKLIEGTMQIPPYPAGKVLDSSHYVGFGYDFVYQTGPTIDVAPVQVWRPDAVVEDAPAWLDSQLSFTR